MQFTHLGRSGLKVSRLCLGTMNFAWKTNEAGLVRHHGPVARRSGSISSILPTFTATPGARASRSRSSGVGSLRAAAAASALCSPPRCTGPWAIGQTTRSCRRSTSAGPATLRWPGFRPTTSTFTRCTTSTGPLPGTKSGRRWKCSASRARSSTPARRTSPVGTSPRRKRRRLGAISWGSSVSSRLYNLFVRDVEREVLPAAQDYGVGIIAWSPLQGGLLGGVLGKEDGPGRRFEDQRAKRRHS